jgi:hypothetical protein
VPGGHSSPSGSRVAAGAAVAAAPAARRPPSRRRALLLGGVALVALLIVAWFTLFRDPDRPAVGRPGEEAAPPAPGPERALDDPLGAAGRQPEVPEPAVPAPGAERATASTPVPASPAIADFDPTPDTSADEWRQMHDWTERWLKSDAGDEDDGARKELVQQGRKAVPVILNALKEQDFQTPEGLGVGNRCRSALAEISNGAEFAAVRDEADPAAAHRRLVTEWAAAWRQAEQSIENWIELARLDEEDPDEAARLRERFGGLGPPEEPGEGE